MPGGSVSTCPSDSREPSPAGTKLIGLMIVIVFAASGCNSCPAGRRPVTMSRNCRRRRMATFAGAESTSTLAAAPSAVSIAGPSRCQAPSLKV